MPRYFVEGMVIAIIFSSLGPLRGETLDLKLPDRTTMMLSTLFFFLRASFWSSYLLELRGGGAMWHLLRP